MSILLSNFASSQGNCGKLEIDKIVYGETELDTNCIRYKESDCGITKYAWFKEGKTDRIALKYDPQDDRFRKLLKHKEFEPIYAHNVNTSLEPFYLQPYHELAWIVLVKPLVQDTLRYPNGKLHVLREGHYGKAGKVFIEHGTYVDFFGNGDTMSFGNYFYGIPIGEWVTYDSDGTIKKRATYDKNGSLMDFEKKEFAKLEGFSRKNNSFFTILARSQDNRFVFYRDLQTDEGNKGHVLDLKHDQLVVSNIQIEELISITAQWESINPNSSILVDEGRKMLWIRSGEVIEFNLTTNHVSRQPLFGKDKRSFHYHSDPKLLYLPNSNTVYVALETEYTGRTPIWTIYQSNLNLDRIETSFKLYGVEPHILESGFAIADSDSLKLYDFNRNLKWYYVEKDLHELAFCSEDKICFLTISNQKKGTRWKAKKHAPRVVSYNTTSKELIRYKTTNYSMGSEAMNGTSVNDQLICAYTDGQIQTVDLLDKSTATNLIRANIIGDADKKPQKTQTDDEFVSNNIHFRDENFLSYASNAIHYYKNKALCSLIPVHGDIGMYVLTFFPEDANVGIKRLGLSPSPYIESFSKKMDAGKYQTISSDNHSSVKVFLDKGQLKTRYSVSSFTSDIDLSKASFDIRLYPAYFAQEYYYYPSPSREFVAMQDTFKYCDSIDYGWPDGFIHKYRSAIQATEDKIIMSYWLDTNRHAFTDDIVHDGLVFYNADLTTSPDESIVYFKYTLEGEYLFYTSDNYYFGTSEIVRAHHFVYNNNIYPIEQFDIKYNRPDIILQRLGYADSSLVSAYHQAYNKRLKRLGISKEMLKDDFHIPDLNIVDPDSLPDKTDQGHLPVKIKARDDKYKLNRINVYVNNVAVFGSQGIPLRDLQVNNLEKELKIPLRYGDNFVEISVLNEAGAESLKDYFNIKHVAPKTKPDLYLICIGQGKYQQAEFNLKYAEKDARDVASTFEKQKIYDRIYSKVLLSEAAVKDSLQNLKNFFDKADVNDQAVIFIAGHGVLDENLDYFLATYDMDFNDPSKKGIPYSFIESLLDGIAPQQKVLMIDACHSGEIDKEEVVLTATNDQDTENIQFRAIGVGLKRKLNVKNTFELTNLLFSDLRKGTGATVVSSAGGMEFAIEGDEWKNGLFTYCLLKGLGTQQADLNGDKEIWFSELKTYVSSQVEELSGGHQKPNSRIENKRVDFRLR